MSDYTDQQRAEIYFNCKLIIIPEITMTCADSEANPKMWETPHLGRTAGDLNPRLTARLTARY